MAIATELGAIYVAVGAGVNALEGIYNMATGDSGGGKGGEWAPPAGAAAKSPVRSNRYTKPIFMASGPALARA